MDIKKSDTPVGTIIAYGGDAEKQRENLKNSGWLICDGVELPITEYEELHKAISQNFGGPSENKFNLPDLRGLFLRGVSGESKNDPDAKERIALAANGKVGNEVGSFQNYATGIPQRPFRASIPNNKIGRSKLDSGACVDDAGRYRNEDGWGKTDGTGGDKETRPMNVYVYFLIKWTNLGSTGEPAVPPVGSILSFAGESSAALSRDWTPCDGDERQNVGKFEHLFKAIGTAFGSSGETKFNLPDLRGYFLRGVNQDAEGRDPESKDRTAQNDNGNTGNRVGSRQKDATAYPVSAGFRTRIPHLPIAAGNAAISGFAKNVYKWNKNTSEPIAVTQGGGDDETRPTNVVIDWYILFRKPMADPLPVGSIIAYGGEPLPENDHWLLCDGKTLQQTDHAALYAAIKDLYADPDPETANGQFKLPDLRGRFLRGSKVDEKGAGHVLGETQPYTTKRPTVPFKATFEHLPVSSKGTHGLTRSDNTGKDGSGEQDACTEGGDAESRPMNVAVYFYIKANA